MSVAVLIPYHDFGDEYRRRALTYVKGWFTAHFEDWPLSVSDMTAARFTKARALNLGVQALDEDVIVQCDPDSILDDPQRLHLAVERALEHPGLVIPHNRYCYLAQGPTAAFLAGELTPEGIFNAQCDEMGHFGRGNLVVYTKETWRLAGGYDERFPLWGGDDAAFAMACEALAGPPTRLRGDVIHLWHPRLPQTETTHPGYIAQFAILSEYRDANEQGPEAVRKLVEKRRASR